MKKVNRTARIAIRVTPSEKERIIGFAETCGLQVSDYMRLLGLKGVKLRVEQAIVPLSGEFFEEEELLVPRSPVSITMKDMRKAPKPQSKKVSGE